MGIFRRRAADSAHKAATKARQRGDSVYVRVIHAIPGRPEGGLAQAMRTEAAGWKLEQQREDVRDDHGYPQKYWTLTFRTTSTP